jgi:hypothetical protein
MAKKQTKSQFTHLELYSRIGAIQQSGGRKTSIDGVSKEALRYDGFTDHIIADGYEPVPPTILYSQDNKTLEEHCDDILTQVATEKDNLGRRIKTDKNILLAGVISYPKPRLADNWTEDDRQNFELFKETSIEFIKKKWGDNLLCILEHTDEQYPHFHFYVTNKNRVASTPELHPGFAENIRLEQKAKAEGKPVVKKEQVAAYKEAMRVFQDEFFNEVGIYCGFDRLGPSRQRMNRTEWKERKRATKLLAKAFQKVKQGATDINDKSKALNQSMLELEQQIANVIDMQNKVEQEHKELETGLANLELAKFVRENYKEIVAQFNIQKMRNKSATSQKLKI